MVGGVATGLADWAKQHLNLTIKPVSRPKDASGFVVLPRRWVVERSLAWMMHAPPPREGLRTPPFRRRVVEKTQFVIVGRLEELHILLEQLAADRNGPRPTLPAAGFEAAAQLIDRCGKVVQLYGNP